MQRGLATSGLLTAGFLAGQLFVWKQLNDAGYFVSTNAATAFFYLFTAVHGLHVLGALYHHFIRRDDTLRRMT